MRRNLEHHGEKRCFRQVDDPGKDGRRRLTRSQNENVVSQKSEQFDNLYHYFIDCLVGLFASCFCYYLNWPNKEFKFL